MDFVTDTTADGSRPKVLTAVDETSSDALNVKASRNLTGKAVALELEVLITLHGAPNCVRGGNGPEFAARAARRHLAHNQIECPFIEPASPGWNSYAESFRARLRGEYLSLDLFTSVFEAQAVIEKWSTDYSQECPRRVRSYHTPSQALRQATPPPSRLDLTT